MGDTTAIPLEGWYDTIQGDVYTLLESPAGTNRVRKAVIFFIASLILLNVVVVILETVNSVYLEYTTFFHVFDLVTVIVFSIEYILRIWCCVRNPLYSDPVQGRIRYALSPYALTDAIALTPFYLPLIIPIEFRLLRLLRLLRIFRVLRLGKYSNAFEMFVSVLRSKREEIVITVIMAIMVLILASSTLYVVERDVQPEAFGSIPHAMWWAVSALSTVGYGDVVPITPPGKFFAAIVAISAIGLFALPAGLLAHGFADAYHSMKHEHDTDKTLTCPRCGAGIDRRTGAVQETQKKGAEKETHEEMDR
ncbi:MAG: ion transporter [Methanoregulaceae archaeon]|nr:MAG: ion transporter [Methanoregulaceae archaeon]